MPRCLVVYDISHDGTRTRVADACLDYGLDRIQYSAFVGVLARTHQEELMLKIGRLIRRWGGNVQLFSLCDKCWASKKGHDVEQKAVPPEPAAPRERPTPQRERAPQAPAQREAPPPEEDDLLGDLPGVEPLDMGGGR